MIYVADSGKVPIASKGTVVGLTQTTRDTWLDVVFDVSFMSGTSLGDRCSPFRGSTVPTWTVLNLTNRQILASSKASANRNTLPTTPLTVSAYGMPGINGQTQYREVAPPPALRGGWRGVVAGGRGSGRGRGGVDGTAQTSLAFRTPTMGQPAASDVYGSGANRGGYRGGYHQIDRGDDQLGVAQYNPNFRPKPQHNVPPPSSLEQNGTGRGRGR